MTDPARPRYHFTAPAGWLNDPNGTIYHDGWFHLFYQHHPFSDEWGPMHWGHARSRDLLQWEHLPIALTPAMDGRENGIWSGCVVINRLGQPVALYTRSNFPSAEGAQGDFTQDAAIGSADLIVWEKLHEPVLKREGVSAGFRADWRDPFVFHTQGRTFMVVGMTGAGLPLYEAVDDAFLQWEFRGIVSEIDAECPNFFEVDGHWLYLWSPFNNVQAALGEFDLAAYRFRPHWQGRYDWSEFLHSDYYATNHLYAPDGRSILFGWIRGWAPGHGWNGCMGIPREVRVDAKGVLRTPPIAEMAALRTPLVEAQHIPVHNDMHRLGVVADSQYELHCRLSLGSAEAAGFNLCLAQDGTDAHRLWIDRDGIHLDGVHIPLSEEELGQPVDVLLFMDNSVAELFVDKGRYCAVRVLKDFEPANTGLGLFSQGGQAHFHDLQVWSLRGCDNQD